MTNEDLADRIMFRIEREGAIHKSSIVQELELVLGKDGEGMEVFVDGTPNETRYEYVSGITDLLWGSKRDGYPVQPETGTEILHQYNAQIFKAQKAQEARMIAEINKTMFGDDVK